MSGHMFPMILFFILGGTALAQMPARGWNATEVYRRTKNGWRIIHTHWSLVKLGQP